MTVTDRPIITLDEVHRFSVEEYQQMELLGAFEELRAELIHGYLLDMHAKSPPHENAIRCLAEWLRGRVDLSRHFITIAGSVEVDDSQPEPDLMVSNRDKPKDKHPTRAQLVIEVAVSSIRRDLQVKPAIYAATVDEYWVVDVEGRRVVVHRDPHDGAYRSITSYTPDQSLALLLLPDQPMSFGDLFAAV